MPSTSKSQEIQISDTLDIRYSSFDENIDEIINYVDNTKKKENNIQKSLQSKKQNQIRSKYKHSNIQKDLQTKKQDEIVSRHEYGDNPNSYTAIEQSQSKTTFSCFHRYNFM